jgi:hypothetical protein
MNNKKENLKTITPQSDLLAYYGEALTQSLLQKWLREVHNIHISILLNFSDKFFSYTITDVNKKIGALSKKDNYKTYEEALEEALEEGLNLIKL